jgi:hypothetical protein
MPYSKCRKKKINNLRLFPPSLAIFPIFYLFYRDRKEKEEEGKNGE